MTDTPSQPMTDKTIARLLALGKDNGITCDNIQLIETKEETYTLSGRLTLTPQLEIKTTTASGRVKGKGRASKLLSSFQELQTEIESLKKDFEEEGAWKEDAAKELEKTDGMGWGMHSALLFWSDQKTILGATEKCPTCKGGAQHPCHECRGLGHLPCHYCESRGQELCYQCNGSRQDPYNPANKCPTCNGTGYALCRYCQGQMKLPCTRCQGRGHMPCEACNGNGSINREVEIEKGASMDFMLGPTSHLPSGLLRGLSRIGDEKLCKGHADFSAKPLLIKDDPNVDKGGPLLVNLEAKIPYADIKLKIAGKGCVVSCFGKLARLSGVPSFLDEALAEARAHLKKAVEGEEPVEMALGPRAMKEAFTLILSGKTHPNNLRRLYPVGLSGDAAQEIMRGLVSVFRKSTARTRMIVGGVCVFTSALLFAAVSWGGLFPFLANSYGTLAPAGAKAALLIVALGASWQALRIGARIGLAKQFQQTKVATPLTVGRTGVGTLAAIALLFFAILFLSGNLI